VHRRVKKLSGILSFQHDMCINSCMIYTGPFRKLEECMYCKEPPQIPHKTFTTMPIGPQLQALLHNLDTA
ncbi:hypothetical protein C8J56DRAFT_786546, partial [Mycena floridula]